MSLTKKTPLEFKAKMFELGIFVHGVKVLHGGEYKAPDALATEYPNRITCTSHDPDIHSPDPSPNPSGLQKIKKTTMTLSKLMTPTKTSMSVSIQCASFRYPVVIWEKGASKICCLEMEIIIPGPNNDAERVEQYLRLFEYFLSTLENVRVVRVLYRFHKDQAPSSDPSMSTEDYMRHTFEALGQQLPTIRKLCVCLFLERASELKRFQIQGQREEGEMKFRMVDWHGAGM